MFVINRQSGFTLLELIAVMVISSILAVTAMVKFSANDTGLQAVKSDLLAAFIVARGAAMARSDGNSSIRLVLTSTSVDVQVNSVSINTSSQRYPLTLSSDLTTATVGGVTYLLSFGATAIIEFNTLGETLLSSLPLEEGGFSDSITVSRLGYAY